MQTISKDELLTSKDIFIKKIRDGALFIYPTDTIYGIGCDATNEEAVKRVREVKERLTSPFSVIAPSIDWIQSNCELNAQARKWLKRLPGPYTLILQLKDDTVVAPSVNAGLHSIGVRIPDHWMTDFVKELKIPVITTSVNKAGDEFMTSSDSIDSDIQSKVDFIVTDGEKAGNPSTLVDLTSATAKVTQR